MSRALLPLVLAVLSSGCASSAMDSGGAGAVAVVDSGSAGAVAVADVSDPRSLGEPEKLADVPTDGDTVTLHLYVSNQSFDVSPVDIEVWLGDTHVVTGGFEVENQHTWVLFDLQVPANTHLLHAEALGGSVVIDEAVPAPEERWGVLQFWYDAGDPTHPLLSWDLSETPVGFQ